MDDAFERGQELISTYDEELRKELPTDAEIFDAHVHLGNDIDTFKGTYEELERIMDANGISRAFMFCMDEPDRHPGFRAPNDRTLEHAKRSEGRLIPFVRLDLGEDPIDEAERCLDLGARGIKLHPRAQSFLLNDERLAPVFALAAERKVPILIHGGRGLPPIADHLARLVDGYPEAQLIIAHAGIADLAGLAGHFAGKRGRLLRHLGLEPGRPARLLPPGLARAGALRAPTTRTGGSRARCSSRCEPRSSAGLDEEQLRDMLAGNANRIAERRAAAQADRAEAASGTLPAVDGARAHPPVPLDGDAAPLDAPARHDRRHRPRAERLRRAQRLPATSSSRSGSS